MRAVLVVLFLPAACTGMSQPSNMVVAPTMPGASATSAAAPLDDAAEPPVAFDAGAPDDDAGAPSRFRGCGVDADCVAVPHVGCCHNGWMEAVAASQRDAYASSFVCPNPHPICAMHLIRDTREAKCVRATGLCTMVSK